MKCEDVKSSFGRRVWQSQRDHVIQVTGSRARMEILRHLVGSSERACHQICDKPSKVASLSYHEETADSLKCRHVPGEHWLDLHRC